ncbi:MAG: DUF433 domain-containing protein [Anaerolineae bacterium]|nr:DUF433 domain-containing protein [Anaerolineae bacterium]
MIALPDLIALPLKMDPHGAIRVSGTRVTLDTLIGYYHQGETPEDLHDSFPTVPLADIYAVIAYYLAHQTELDAYLKERDQEAARIRRQWETRKPQPTRAELIQRLQKDRHDTK